MIHVIDPSRTKLLSGRALLVVIALLSGVACSNKGATGRFGRLPTSEPTPDPNAPVTPSIPHIVPHLGGSVAIGDTASGFKAKVSISPLQQKDISGGGYTIKFRTIGD